MKEKINYTECMKRKCSVCKYYDKCFEYKKRGVGKCQEEDQKHIKK